MQPGPWLRPARSYSPYKTRQTCQRDEATGQPRQTKRKQTNSGRNQPLNVMGGRKSLWRVCVCVMLGPAVLSHLSKLAASRAHQTNIKTGRADQQQQSRAKPANKTRGQTTRGATSTTPKHTQAAKRAETAKERTGTMGTQAEASNSRTKRKEGPGGGSKDRRMSSTGRGEGRMPL